MVEAETKDGGACVLFAKFLDIAATFRKNNDNGDGLGMPECHVDQVFMLDTPSKGSVSKSEIQQSWVKCKDTNVC
jgi:hypothetical protein